MQFFTALATLIVLTCSQVNALPTGTRSALEARQTNNSGSTSTSTSNNNGLVNLGSSGAAAAEDGQSTSSTSTSSCGKLMLSSIERNLTDPHDRTPYRLWIQWRCSRTQLFQFVEFIIRWFGRHSRNSASRLLIKELRRAPRYSIDVHQRHRKSAAHAPQVKST